MSIVCPSGATIEGIDVSHSNGTVDWAMVKSAGIVFAYTRIADNTTPDPQFATNWSGMEANGVVRGAYHFFDPSADPTAQANYVVGVLGKLAAAELPVVVDVETTGGQPPATIAANLATFVDAVAAGTGKQPIIYTANGFWETNVQSAAFASDPLWVAAWSAACPNLPSQWTSWVMWQDSSTATVSGVPGNVDHDLFNGSASDLATFAGMTISVDGALDGLPVRDVSDLIDAPLGGDARGGQPAAGKGGGCCDASGAPDTAATLVVAFALGRRRRVRRPPACRPAKPM
jgi:lysozyme